MKKILLAMGLAVFVMGNIGAVEHFLLPLSSVNGFLSFIKEAPSTMKRVFFRYFNFNRSELEKASDQFRKDFNLTIVGALKSGSFDEEGIFKLSKIVNQAGFDFKEYFKLGLLSAKEFNFDFFTTSVFQNKIIASISAIGLAASLYGVYKIYKNVSDGTKKILCYVSSGATALASTAMLTQSLYYANLLNVTLKNT